MSDSSIAGSNPVLQQAYDTSWFGVDSAPPSSDLIKAAITGLDVTATDKDDPTKPAANVVAANGGVTPTPMATGIAAQVGKTVSDFAVNLGTPVAAMNALYAQGKVAGAATVTDALQQGQAQAAVTKDTTIIQQAQTADMAKIANAILGNPDDPNSSFSQSVKTITDAQAQASALTQKQDENMKTGFFDDPGQWFLNKVTSIGDQSKIDRLNTNIINEQTKLRNNAGLATDIGKVTAAADATGLVQRGADQANLDLKNSALLADTLDQKAAATNMSNLHTINEDNIAAANERINAGRLIVDQQNTALATIRTALAQQEAPLTLQRIQETLDLKAQQLGDKQADNARVQSGATLLGISDADKLTAEAVKRMPVPVRNAILAASEGHMGTVPASPASALQNLDLVQPKNLPPVVAGTVAKLRNFVTAVTPSINADIAARIPNKQFLAQLPPEVQRQELDKRIDGAVASQINQGPEQSGAGGLYALPSLSSATADPFLQKLPLVQNMKPLIDADKQGGKQYPVRGQDIVDTAYSMYKSNPTPENLKQVAAQVSQLGRTMVNNRNSMQNYSALGLPAPNSFNSTLKLPGQAGISLHPQVHIDINEPAQVEQYLMKRRMNDEFNDTYVNNPTP